MFVNPVPRVPSFYIRTKFRLKNLVNTVHLLQCKEISSFICAFEGEIYGKLKNINLGKPPLKSRKRFFDSFTLVYIRLDLSSDSSTLVYIRLNSPTLVYTRLVTRLCFKNRYFYKIVFKVETNVLLCKKSLEEIATAITIIVIIKNEKRNE